MTTILTEQENKTFYRQLATVVQAIPVLPLKLSPVVPVNPAVAPPVPEVVPVVQGVVPEALK